MGRRDRDAAAERPGDVGQRDVALRVLDELVEARPREGVDRPAALVRVELLVRDGVPVGRVDVRVLAQPQRRVLELQQLPVVRVRATRADRQVLDPHLDVVRVTFGEVRAVERRQLCEVFGVLAHR